MDVNYDIWGSPATWVDGTTAEQKANIKFAESSQDTFRELYTTGKLELNTIDLSAAYWGIGKGSIFRQPHYLSPYQKDGATEVAVDDVIDESQSAFPLMFFTATSVSNQNTRFDYRYSPKRTTAPSQNMPFTAKIVLGFNYKDVILEPLILCKDNTFSSSNRSTTLYDYIENAVYETYPRITGIGYTSYAGDGSTNRSKIYFYPLTTFTIKEYDLYYDTTYFWCQYLSNFLINGVEKGTSQTPIIGVTHTTTTTDINSLIGDSVTALAYKYSANETTRVPFYYFDSENELWKINKTVIRSGSEKWYTYPYIETTAENAETVRDYVLSQIAYLGLPFVYDPSKSAQGQIGDVGVYLPVFDDYGITTGDYEEGVNALRLPNSQWVTGRESGYDPNVRPTPENHDTGDIPNVGNYLRRFGNHLKVWCLYQNDVNTIITAINDLYQSSADPVTQWQTDFQGVNPSDYIAGLYAILIDPPKTENTSTFTLGAVDFDGSISAYKYNFNATNSGFFTFGTVDVPYYGNFRDYAPYTELELYIPLCGTVELDPAYFVGHTIAVDMYYDIYTMSCVAAVSRISQLGKTLYKTVNGTIGAQIPIMSRDMGDYQNTIKSLESAHKQNENRLMTSLITAGVSAGIAIGTGGAALPAMAGIGLGGLGLINTVEQGKLIDYQLDHTQPAIAQTGVAETQNAFCVGQLKAKLNIKRAAELPHNDSIYSQTVGNACCINAIVGDRTGLIVCSNIKCEGITNATGDSPTVDEINAIKQAFANGVIV